MKSFLVLIVEKTSTTIKKSEKKVIVNGKWNCACAFIWEMLDIFANEKKKIPQTTHLLSMSKCKNGNYVCENNWCNTAAKVFLFRHWLHIFTPLRGSFAFIFAWNSHETESYKNLEQKKRRNVYTHKRRMCEWVCLFLIACTHTKEMRLSLRNGVKMRQRMLFTIIMFALTNATLHIMAEQPPYTTIIIISPTVERNGTLYHWRKL